MSVPDEKELKNSRFQDRSKRCTNPVSPEYILGGLEIKDDAKYSKPKPLKPYIDANMLLRTDDIDGAKEGFGKLKRTEVRNITSVADIDGAQADTVKSSIRTARVINPLNPVYTSLDGEPSAPINKPLIPNSFIGKPTLRPHKTGGLPVQAKSEPLGATIYSARSFAEAFEGDKGKDPSLALDLGKVIPSKENIPIQLPTVSRTDD